MKTRHEAHSLITISHARATRFSFDLDTTLHQSHAIKLIVGLDADVSVREPSGLQVCAPVVVIPSDIASCVVSRGPVISVLLDPEHNREPNASTRALGGTVPIELATARRLRDLAWSTRCYLESPRHLDALGEELQAIAFPSTLHRANFDVRVEYALERFRAHLDDADGGELELQSHLGVTIQHFRALFLRDIGISPRTWLLWNRLVRALRIALSGVSLTTAATAAGFSDHAHFSRTCRRLLGYTPGGIVDR
ncbi:helix-turn-helix transcriptional regulator [Vitiosangium sp. GDMCC 1.1324]|uniref:helix-turn-helix transcriptional regulator n=1 Tax=Vitiosangium sp. (strain GDMCC 1.1324) TaxID=2138576 RepID=UPI00130EA9F7|nr:helix-turn-helix transcriptional regulator [Vitiosangium sp. GDMCC 1.1324]